MMASSNEKETQVNRSERRTIVKTGSKNRGARCVQNAGKGSGNRPPRKDMVFQWHPEVTEQVQLVSNQSVLMCQYL